MSQGTVLWNQADHNSSLLPLTLHNGTLYGVENTSGNGVDQLAVKAADGSAVASNYELSPLAFTADGSPVFIEVPASGTGITIGVGLGHAG
jgi:hypothetical protein